MQEVGPEGGRGVRGYGGEPHKQALPHGRFSTEPPSDFDTRDHQAAATGAHKLGVRLASLAAGCPNERLAWPGVSPGRLACSRGLMMVASMACWEPCQSSSPLATTSMRHSSATGTSMFMSVPRKPGASFLADARDCPLKGQSTRGKHGHVCTRSPVVTKRVEATRQAQARGATGSDSRRRRNRITLNPNSLHNLPKANGLVLVVVAQGVY